MTVRIAQATARAVIDQIRGGSRSDMTIMLGEHAASPGFTGDEQAVVAQIERAIAGRDPKVSADVLRHLAGIASTPLDMALLISIGVDPAVVAFHTLSMGAIAFRIGGHEFQITTRLGGPPRMTFDLDIGADVRWSTSAERTMVALTSLPDTMAAALSGRIADHGPVPLASVVSHPVLDVMDLSIAEVRTLEWGGAWLTLAPHFLLTDHSVEHLLAERG